jgi:hypothetical protein
VGLVLTVQESGWPFYALVRNMGAPWYMLDINLGGAGITYIVQQFGGAWYALDRNLGGPHRRCEHGGPRNGRPTPILVIIPTEQSYYLVNNINYNTSSCVE